jgi:DNA primase
LIIKYKLWFAPKDSLELLQYLQNKWFNNKQIILSWLAKKSSSGSLYSFFSNRIIFPIFNSIWDIVAFSWRIFHSKTNTWKFWF